MSTLVDRMLREKKLHPSHRDELLKCHIIKADNVRTYLDESKGGESDLRDLPNCALPFKYLFIEFSVPPPTKKAGWLIQRIDLVENEDGILNDRLLREVKLANTVADVPLRWGAIGELFTETSLYAPIAQTHYLVGQHGELLWSRDEALGKDIPFALGINTRISIAETSPDFDRMMSGIMSSFHVVLWTLAFMHIKNIVIEPEEAPARQSRAHEREHGRPMMKWHTLKIRPMRRDPGEAQGGTHAAPRYHIRRGHFRNYLDTAPLFGKPWGVGTFWFEDALVGRKDKGVVEKTYDVYPD